MHMFDQTTLNPPVPCHPLQVLPDLVLEGVDHDPVVGRTEHNVEPGADKYSIKTH